MADMSDKERPCSAGTPVEGPASIRNPEISLEPLTHFVNHLHKYIMETIIFSDHKAGFLFAAVATVLAYMHSHGATQRLMVAPSAWGTAEVLAILGVICLIASGIATILVVAPRFTGALRGFVYWKAIACYPTSREYANDVLSRDIMELLKAKLENCYDLAHISDRKYRMLAFAIWAGSSGLAISAAYLAVFK
ncbi:MAG: Pycsar system effector family protein [Nitrospirota bacterium]